jgi:hypothetical protein
MIELQSTDFQTPVQVQQGPAVGRQDGVGIPNRPSGNIPEAISDSKPGSRRTARRARIAWVLQAASRISAALCRKVRFRGRDRHVTTGKIDWQAMKSWFALQWITGN